MSLSERDQAFVSSIYTKYAGGTLKMGRNTWFDFPKGKLERTIFRCRAFFVKLRFNNTKLEALNELCQRALSKVPKVVRVSKPTAFIHRLIEYQHDNFELVDSTFDYMVLSRDAFFVTPIAKHFTILHELAHFTGFALQRNQLLYSHCPDEPRDCWVKQEHVLNYCYEEITAEMTALLIFRQFQFINTKYYQETVLEAGMGYINKYLKKLEKIDPTSKDRTLDILSRCFVHAKKARRKILEMAA